MDPGRVRRDPHPTPLEAAVDRSTRSRLTALGASIAAALVTTAVAAPPGQAVTPQTAVEPATQTATQTAERAPSGTLVATPAHAFPGTRVLLTGRSGPKTVHAVKLQRKQAGRWKRIAGSSTTKEGEFTFKVTLPATVKSRTYRVLTPATDTIRRSVTPTRKVLVDRVALLSGDDSARHVKAAISGNGRFVLDGFLGGAQLRRIKTGQVIAIPHEGSAVDLSNNGKAVLMERPDNGIPFVWHRKTGAVVEAAPEFATTEEQHTAAWSISGDGTKILLVKVETATGEKRGLFVQDIVTGEVTKVSEQGGGGDLSFDGRYVASAGSDGERIIDTETMESTSIDPEGTYLLGWPSISDDGRYVAAFLRGDSGDNVWVMDTKTGKKHPSPLGNDTLASDPQISGDGKRVVFALYDETASSDTAYVWDLASDTVRPIITGDETGYIDLTISDNGTVAAGITDLTLAPEDSDGGDYDAYLFSLPLPSSAPSGSAGR